MPIDPITTTAIVATGKWMWDSYGKTFVDGWAKNVMGSREKRQLEKQWQEAIQTYLEKLYDKVNWLHLLGKQEGMPLERIYTDLNILDQPTAERWYDPAMLEEDFVHRRSYHTRREAERQEGLDVIKQFKRLYILGKPGAGKTTLLKFMTLEALRGKLGEYVPFFISLKELSEKNHTIVSFVAEQFVQCGPWDEDQVGPIIKKFVIQLFKSGQAILFFDGLDEVNLENNSRSNLITALKDFVNEFEKCQILITCRIAASDYSFARFKYVEIADFYEEQQKRFIFRWFQDNMVRRDACWDALASSKSANLRELAYVPLLLTLLCIAFEQRGMFPPDLDEVYRVAVNALLFRWDSSRLIERDPVYEGLDVKYRERLLAWIAYESFCRSEYLIEESKLVALIEAYLGAIPRIKTRVNGLTVLRSIVAEHGLLMQQAQGFYSFSHLSLQEYFTARYVVDNVHESMPILLDHVGEETWREVYLLTAGMLYSAEIFFEKYLQSLAQIIAENETLVKYLQWVNRKSDEVKTGIQPTAAKALFIFLSLDLDRSRAVSQFIDHARARSQALARELSIDEFLSRSRAISRVFELSRVISHASIRALTLDLAITYDLRLLTRISLYDYQVEKQLPAWGAPPTELPDWLTESVSRFVAPPSIERQKWDVFNRQLEKLLLDYWNLEEFWQFKEDQAEVLVRFLAGSLIMVECLKVATLPDRAAIEEQFLLPPIWKSESGE